MAANKTDQGILSRLLMPDGRELPEPVARFVLELSLGDSDLDRIRSLSEKANDGTLTEEEREELSTYVLLGDILSIIQTRAMDSLRRVPAA